MAPKGFFECEEIEFKKKLKNFVLEKGFSTA